MDRQNRLYTFQLDNNQIGYKQVNSVSESKRKPS
jgi:hypothetical protein